MLVAVRRYSLALSLSLGAAALAQPALAHGRHHSGYHDARAYGHRHSGFVVAAAPQNWGEQSWGDQSSYIATSPQAYWRHGWRGHLARQAAWQPNGWQQTAWRQTAWRQTAWQQNDWQQQGWQRPRLAHRRDVAYFGGAAGSAPTYYDYAPQSPQSSWAPAARGFGGHSELSGMIAQQASAAGVPLSLAERVVRRESGGNPRAVHAGNYGLMQIRLGTARAMGYSGSAAGLLDPAVNMTYAMRYLAGAYRAAGGSESRAVALYARGYRAVPARAQTYTF
jgi:hypothetical protein